jgi:hypothetical protein
MTYTVEVKHTLLGLGYIKNVDESRLERLKEMSGKEMDNDGNSFTIVSVKEVA